MARRPRLDMAGFHHVLYRGVARSDVFLSVNDKNVFLGILCKACKTYKSIVHDYCLMDNHYHLLLETDHENLSLMMRQVNSNYAIYFNKKYNRSGHLWQGRFKSWYILNEEYLYMLFRYIEHNPLKANMAAKVGEYPYTLAAAILNRRHGIPCTEQSMLRRQFTSQTMLEHLEVALSDEELETMVKEETRKIAIEDGSVKMAYTQTLEEHFEDVESKQDRNLAIINAIEDGYTQSSIAAYANVSTSAISKIVKQWRE